jgi:PAS domain S-box-containing protein
MPRSLVLLAVAAVGLLVLGTVAAEQEASRAVVAEAPDTHAGLGSLAFFLAGALLAGLIAGTWYAWRRVKRTGRFGDELDLFALQPQPDDGHGRLAENELLRTSHTQLRALLDTMAEGLTIRSVPDGRLLFYNQPAARILGLEPGAAERWAVPPQGWQALDEDGRPLAPDALPTMLAARNGAPYRDRVSGLRRPDGSELWLSTSATPLYQPGESRHYAVLTTFSDVTSLKAAQLAARDSQRSLETLVDNVAGVVYRVRWGDPPKPLYVSDGIEQLTGHRAVDILAGSGIYRGEIVAEPAERARLDAAVAEAARARGRYEREYRIRCLDGTLKWVLDRGRVVSTDAGIPVVEGLITDITARKAAEDALRKRHELESLILSISARFMALDPEATDRAVEEALARVGSFVGADRCFVTELDELDRTYTRWLEWCAKGIDPAPQTRQRLPVQLALAAWEPLFKGEPFRIVRLEELPAGCEEWRELLRRAGTRSMAIVPLVLGGRTRGSFGFDVVHGERLWTEDELLLFRVVADLIASALERKRAELALQARIDLESLILAISTRMINLSADALDDAIRNALREVGEFLDVERGYLLLLDETRTVVSARYQWNAAGVSPAPHRQQPQPVARYAYAWDRLLRGEVHYVPRVSELPLRAADYRATLTAAGVGSLLIVPLVVRGEVIGAVGFERLRESSGWGEEVLVLMKVVADILVNAIDRERVYDQVRRLNEELEQRVRERTAQLEAMNQELESFSYSVSHDLRAPLRHIEGYSRILEQEHAGVLDEQGRRFLSRVRAAVERMGQLIDDLLALSRVTRAEMRIEAVDLSALAAGVAQELFAAEPERAREWTIEPGMRAHADRRLIVVVLQNLLGNAWKYTRRKPVSRVHFGQTEREGERAFFIRDNGAGFDPDYAAKLFKPFQRLHGAEEFEGTGIGLATVHRIIARHDGAVWAEGRPEEGATFWFRLP